MTTLMSRLNIPENGKIFTSLLPNNLLFLYIGLFIVCFGARLVTAICGLVVWIAGRLADSLDHYYDLLNTCHTHVHITAVMITRDTFTLEGPGGYTINL